MNFLKGLVDVILAEDLKDSSDVGRNLEFGISGGDSSFYKSADDHERLVNTVSNRMSDLYQIEREKCARSLSIRYGEGCVQQLSELLKSNNETVHALCKQVAQQSKTIDECNNRLEAAATEHFTLSREHASLMSSLESLNYENVNLKAQVDSFKAEIESSRHHISKLNDLLASNRDTFELVMERLSRVSSYQAEIDALKAQLAATEAQVKQMAQQRDKLVSSNVDDKELKQMLLEALQGQDRAIVIAKMIAFESMRTNTSSSQSSNVDVIVDQLQMENIERLRLEKEQLESEVSHLKQVNNHLHDMYADLSKESNQLGDNLLKGALQVLEKLKPVPFNPLQLIFIQPTGVLDFELDPSFLAKPKAPKLAKAQVTRDAWEDEWDAFQPLHDTAGGQGRQQQDDDDDNVFKPAQEGTADHSVSLLPDFDSPRHDKRQEPEPDDNAVEEEKETSATVYKEKVDLSKSAAVWNDDFDEMFN